MQSDAKKRGSHRARDEVAHDARSARHEEKAARVQRVHRDLETIAHLPEQVLSGHAHVLEPNLCTSDMYGYHVKSSRHVAAATSMRILSSQFQILSVQYR